MTALINQSSGVDEITRDRADGTTLVLGAIAEIYNHQHAYERGWGAATSPSGEAHVADNIEDGAGVFQMDAGNDTFGSWIQIMGSDDLPSDPYYNYYEFRRIHAESVERTTSTYIVQIALGDSAEIALAANQYSELTIIPQSPALSPAPMSFGTGIKPVGTKAWARCWAKGQNTGFMNFYIFTAEEP